MFWSDANHHSRLLMTSHAPGDSICQHNAYLELCSKLSEAFTALSSSLHIVEQIYHKLYFSSTDLGWRGKWIGRMVGVHLKYQISMLHWIHKLAPSVTTCVSWVSHGCRIIWQHWECQESTTAPTAVFWEQLRGFWGVLLPCWPEILTQAPWWSPQHWLRGFWGQVQEWPCVPIWTQPHDLPRLQKTLLLKWTVQVIHKRRLQLSVKWLCNPMQVWSLWENV